MHPVIARELRTAARKKGLLKTRFYVAAGACAVTAFFLLASLFDRRAGGRTLEHWLFYGSLLITLPTAFEGAVTLFAEDKRSDNLGLLFLTGMTSIELFGSKLLGGVLIASSQLLAAIPFFAIPFLSGGVSHDLFLASVLSLPVLLLFVVALGVFGSVLCNDDSGAMVTAVAVGAVICCATLIPYYLGFQLAGAAPFSEQWLWLSPAYAPLAVARDMAGVPMRAMWLNWALTVAWTVLFIAASAFVLRRRWREQALPTPVSGQWLLQRFSGLNGESKEQRRSRLLDLNPCRWLSQANQRPLLYGLLFVGGVVVVWLAGWAVWPQQWPNTGNFFVTAFLLISVSRLLAVYATARRFGEERRSGTIELLLTTPLEPTAIIDGHVQAVRDMFRPLRLTVFALCVLMLLGGFLSRPWTARAAISYSLIWLILLVWCLRSSDGVMTTAWVSLNTGRTAPVLHWGNGGGWNYLWLFYNMHALRDLFGTVTTRFPTGSVAELVVVSFVFVISGIVYAGTRDTPKVTRGLIVEHMRSLAQQPIPDRHDPRLKSWDRKEPLRPSPHCDPLKVAA